MNSPKEPKILPEMDVSALRSHATQFEVALSEQKHEVGGEGFPWYPYGTLNNLIHLDNLLKGRNRQLANLIGELPVADVGAADGDMAFFMESLGCTVDVVDYGPTNFNTLRGARLLKEARKSNIGIHEINLDTYFEWPRSRYGLVLFMGILYHLKNPFYVLESLAKVTRYAIVSTRIAQYSPDLKTRLAELPVGYLLHASEANNDATNYWIFSDAGLRRIVDRTGWKILDYMTAGNTQQSDPASSTGDERAFVLLESRVAA
ncbi:MAG: hypothetical protein ABI583_03340 [Betaproteobacteria bacterium]